MISGDGHVGVLLSPSQDRTYSVSHRFRLALADLEPLIRTRDYLSDMEIAAREFQFQKASGERREIRAISVFGHDRVWSIRGMIEWPGRPTDDWVKGFLAGIFDAEGGCTGALRIFNTDPEIIDWVTLSLRRFGFSYVTEQNKGTNRPVIVIRLLGGLKERLRFFLT